MKKLLLLSSALLVVSACLMSLQAGSPTASSDFTNRLKDIERRVMAAPKEAGLPAGTIVLSLAAECPAGFTRATALEGLFLKGASAAEPVGTRGGAPTHNHKATVDFQHTHDIYGVTQRPRFMGFGKGGKEFDRVADENHEHEFRVRTDSVSVRTKNVDMLEASSQPPYAAVLFCAKD